MEYGSCTDSRAQLAREAAYQLLAKPPPPPPPPNVGSQTKSTGSDTTFKRDTTEYANGPRAQKHDTISYLLVAISVILWMVQFKSSQISKDEAYAAAAVDLLRVTAVTAIIYVLDWSSKSLLICEDECSESRRSSLARTFALCLVFVMVADGMRLDVGSLW